MRKILYISGTRADYGLMRRALGAIAEQRGLKLEVVATGMHLMKGCGRTIEEIRKDGFKIHRISAVYDGFDQAAMARFIGKFILVFTQKLKVIKPDIILVLGDRAEMLAAAVAGVYSGIPVAHIHGGDISSTVDEISRHAITKLAHLHFPATAASAARIIKMGEEPWRVYTVGAPGLDGIITEASCAKNDLAKRFNLDLSLPLVLVLQHPVTCEITVAGRQMRETMSALRKLNLQAVLAYPNADAGSVEMIRVIEGYRDLSFLRVYKNIPHHEFLSLMKVASVMLGNSSSAIIEAAAFGLPVVNIGTRQQGRERGSNVIDTAHDRGEIAAAIKHCLAGRKRKFFSPYGNSGAGTKIARILARVHIDKKLLQKKLAY